MRKRGNKEIWVNRAKDRKEKVQILAKLCEIKFKQKINHEISKGIPMKTRFCDIIQQT